MDADKVKAIIDCPYPNSHKEVKGLLGLTSYCRKFIKSYEMIAQRLTALLKKSGFEWSELCQNSWDQLKQAVVTTLVLTLPHFNLNFVVESKQMFSCFH